MSTDDILILSHHRKKSLKRCKFKSYLRYIRRKRKVSNDINLIFGTAIHRTLEIYYRRQRDISFNDLVQAFYLHMDIGTEDTILLPKIETWKTIGFKILERYYSLTKEKEQFQIIAVEVPFFLSISKVATILLDSLKDNEIHHDAYFVLAGKVDLIIQVGQDVYFVDHKTTTQTQDRFMEQFTIDEQLLDYSIYGNWFYGDKFKGVMINGINKRIDGVDPPIFRDWFAFSEEEIHNALIGYLDIAQEYYILNQAPHLMQTRTVEFDCNRCDFLDVSIAKRKGEDWERVLELYYEDLDKMDWEE
mgnify:CR=1 FL=1|jgi:hypothetical protein